MSYVDRMCIRLFSPCLAVLAVAGLIAWLFARLGSLPMFGQAFGSGLPFLVWAAGLLLMGAVAAVQGYRLWRWMQGRASACFVCTCMLGAEREGRWGIYRKCLGCGKNHSASNAAR